MKRENHPHPASKASQTGLPGALAPLFATLLALTGPGLAEAQHLTRSQAASALLSPISGVLIDTNQSTVWSPFVNYGFGSGYEGLLPAGSLVDPHESGWLPYLGPGLSVASPAYFFWVDDAPSAQFQHPARFVLVNATNPAPTVANGGIVVSAQGWWPKVYAPGFGVNEHFHDFDQIATSLPAGAGNPKGLIAGYTLSDSPTPRPPDGANKADTATFDPQLFGGSGGANACGLIVRGDSRFDFGADVPRFENDLTNHYKIPPGRVTKVKNGAPASSADLSAAIAALCAAQPPCNSFFIRMTSHGSKGGFSMTDGTLSASNLCAMLKCLVDKGVPICMMINSCYSGSLLDAHNWGFPAGSVVMTSTDSNNVGYGWTYFDGTNKFTGSIFPYAHSQFLNANPTNNAGLDSNGDGFVSDEEAQAWVLKVRPCYALEGATNTMRYPAGQGTNNAPNPQIRTVGTDPKSINVNVKNATGAPKTDFHMIFQGNVANGILRAWRSNPQDQISTPWAVSNRTVTYDPTKNETMVCWQDNADPVAPEQFIHFGYAPVGGGLRPVRQYWTPTGTPPSLPDRVPTTKTSLDQSGTHLRIRLLSNSSLFDGWASAAPAFVMVTYSPTNIALQNLTLFGVFYAPGSLAPLLTTNFLLFPDTPQDIGVTLPFSIPSGATVVAAVQLLSEFSSTPAAALNQFELLPATPAPVKLNLARAGDFVVLIWDSPGAILESASDANGSWLPLYGATSPYYINTKFGQPQSYFRLFLPTQ